MVAATEQNLIVNNVKVIAIKLPFDLQERILTFPFLHALRLYHSKAEIHFITPKINIEVLNLLPFKAFYHEFDEDEIKSIFDVYRFSVNSHIYNVDLFVSLTNSFPDACLGLGLRAKQRLGYSDGWKTLVLNQKTPRPVGHHLCESFLSLYSVHTGKESDPRIKITGREVDPIMKDWSSEPYVAIDLSPLRDAMIDQEWVDLISQFENQKIVLFASDDQDKAQSMFQTFMAILPPSNTYVNFKYKDWIDLSKMLAFARGVICYQGALAAFSAYMGARTLIIYDRDDPQRTAPFYFVSDVAILSATDPNAVHKLESTGILKKRVRMNMEGVFVKAMEFFSLK
jgi:ADP-heptose:LPS heptosyltransferase